MSQNALLGKRISLISMKEIRYEGALYSINEQNSTVALQNVRAYGTEGREQANPEITFMPPQATVHPYLLFRGCDIKDLHVHDSQPPVPVDPAGSVAATTAPATVPPPASELPLPPVPPVSAGPSSGTNVKESTEPSPPVAAASTTTRVRSSQPESQAGRGGDAQNRRPKKQNPAHQVGTGASLLNRKARGTVEGGPAVFKEEFDFQSKLQEFEKEDNEDLEDEEAGDEGPTAYAKDDFFDLISCDALDRERGIDNRLRGALERDLNTETFGAVALNTQRRRRAPGPGRGGGRSGGGEGGRGGWRESGRGEDRSGGRGGGAWREAGRGGRGRGRGRGGRGRGRQGSQVSEST